MTRYSTVHNKRHALFHISSSRSIITHFFFNPFTCLNTNWPRHTPTPPPRLIHHMRLSLCLPPTTCRHYLQPLRNTPSYLRDLIQCIVYYFQTTSIPAFSHFRIFACCDNISSNGTPPTNVFTISGPTITKKIGNSQQKPYPHPRVRKRRFVYIKYYKHPCSTCLPICFRA